MAEADQTVGAPIVMPKLGLTMAEGLIAEWLVKPGDEVSAGQILFVVETDKISNDIEASAPGRIIRLLAAAGETVPVGEPVALWTGPGPGGREEGPASPAAPVEIAVTTARQTVETSPGAGERVLATPLARRLAQRGGLELGAVAGTGPRGRIQARDVQALIDRRTAPGPEAGALVRRAEVSAPVASERPERRDHRSLIAARVSRSKAEIPHFYVSADAVFDDLAALRDKLNADPAAPGKLSVTALLGMAAARALAAQPRANAVWREGRAVRLDQVAIAVAVDTPVGVAAPVVPVGDRLYDFAAALDAAVVRARGGRMTTADLGPAALGLSNVGMFGVKALTPIIDPDQSFMLGVGGPWIAFRPSEDGGPKTVRLVTLTLACDHRLIDGAPAARLLSEIVGAIENPLRLLVWPPVESPVRGVVRDRLGA
jgi:pyruvate dehydrogenase E2 component (dihydrolipoamide acetyltransferase)